MKLGDLGAGRCFENGVAIAGAEFEIHAAHPKNKIWTNTDADKMAAVAKLTRKTVRLIVLDCSLKSCTHVFHNMSGFLFFF